MKRIPWILLLSLAGCGWMVREVMILYITVDSHLVPSHVSIEIDRPFIEKYKNRVTVRTVFTVDAAMSAPLPPPLDGDLHIAGRARQVELPIVAEIANARDEQAAIDVVNRAAARHATVRMSGVWRIWPEHAGRAKEDQGEPLGPLGSDKPEHVFEIHPVTRIDRVSLLDSFKPVKGFSPGDAERTFGIFQKATYTLKVMPKKVAIVVDTGLYNDIEFVMKVAPDPQLVVSDGRFVVASAMDHDGKLLVQRLRTVFVRGTPPELAVKQLKSGEQLHVYGMPRIDFAEIARRVKESRTNPALLKQPLPYEVIILGVYTK